MEHNVSIDGIVPSCYTPNHLGEILMDCYIKSEFLFYGKNCCFTVFIFFNKCDEIFNVEIENSNDVVNKIGIIDYIHILHFNDCYNDGNFNLNKELYNQKCLLGTMLVNERMDIIINGTKYDVELINNELKN